MKKRMIKIVCVYTGAALLLVLLSFLSLWKGNSSAEVGFGEMIAGIFTGNNPTVNLFMRSRGPRTAIAVLGGACFAVSGVTLQSATGNRLADASVIGMSSSTYLGHFLFASLFPTSAVALAFSPVVAAIVGGAVVTGVAFLSWNRGLQSNRMLLVGTAVNSIAIIVILTVYLTSGTNASAGLNALVGNLGNQITETDILSVLICTVIGIGAAVFMIPSCNLLSLGDKTASGLGLNVTRTKFVLLGISVFCCATATFKLGITAFVGLLCPLLAKKILGSNHKHLVPLSALLGALLVLICDLICRLASTVVSIPVGIITTIAGGVVFLILLKRSFSHGS